MLQKTKAVALHYIKHSETSIIAYLLTEQFGIRTYIVNGARGKRGKLNYFQPLSILDLDVYERGNKNLQRIKDIKFYQQNDDIRFNYTKNYISFFIAEILYRTLIFDEQDIYIFNFVINYIDIFNKQKDNYFNFHLFFLIELTNFLGFYPYNNYTLSQKYFDMQEGLFVAIEGPVCMNDEQSELLSQFLGKSISEVGKIKIHGKQRSLLIDEIMRFYTLHNHSLSNLNSLKVLKECF